MDLREQVKWEKEMLAFGIARFRGQDAKSKDRGWYTETSAGSKLLRGYLTQVSQHIQHYYTSTNRGKYVKLLKTVDADKLALFALHAIIAAVYEDVSVARVVQTIGTMVEDELRFTKFYLERPEFFEALQRDLDKKNSQNYRHRHRVLTHTMNREGIQWLRWDTQTTCGVGELVLRLALESTDLVSRSVVRKGRKTVTALSATDEVHDWIRSSNDAVAVMLPDRMPCLIPPEDWTDGTDGGYHTPRMRMITPMIKTRRGPTGEIQKLLIAEADMPGVYDAINTLQGTPWRINKPVLAAMQEIWDANLAVGMPSSQPYTVPASPVDKEVSKLTAGEKVMFEAWKAEAREVYALEQKRKALVLGVARTMRIGEMLKDKEQFYYVWQCDFRGRQYAATTGVSPQGSDHAKGVLEFQRGKALGKDGYFWLAVHGANKYGHDKVSYKARRDWAVTNVERWQQIAADPVGNRDMWKDADKPYQFLAWCLEFTRAHAAADRPRFISHIPIALDGSCNGLQHFSAMLRDPVGGAAVNLTSVGDEPADIYQEVADTATRHLREEVATNGPSMAAAQNWLDLFKALQGDGMSRKLSKQPVMTLPYGSTQQACTSSIFKWYSEQMFNDFFPTNTNFLHCIYLSGVLWRSISEVVIAAKVAMRWLQEVSSILAKKQHPMEYHSALGFPVFQASRKVDRHRIDSAIGGSRMTLRIVTDREELDVKKQRQGASPNFVHHVDATHAMMCLNAGAAEGIQDFAMVHDDFGVHACHVTRWHFLIRQQFVKLHKRDVLAEFKDTLETLYDVELPDLPEKGTLDLDDVMGSHFFFG